MNTWITWGRRMGAVLTMLGVMGLLALPAAAQLRGAELVVGQVAPLSGVLASTGAQMVLGGRIYFDAINAQGGIHGAKIRHEVVDDGYKIAETVRLTREMLARPEVVALFGFAGTANVTQLLTDGVLDVQACLAEGVVA